MIFRKQSKKKTDKSQNEESMKLKEDYQDENGEVVSFEPNVKKTEKNEKKKNPSLVKVLVREFGAIWLLGVLYKVFQDCLAFCQPQLLA